MKTDAHLHEIRLHYIFHGRVQGVGFRYQAYYMAKRLGLLGWVKNLYNGTVEMEVQGKEEQIDTLICSFYESPLIRIEDMDIEKIPLEIREKEFKILN